MRRGLLVVWLAFFEVFAAQAQIAYSPGTIATPVDSPGAGTYSAEQSVTLTDASASILCYTTDGSTPTGNATSCTHGTQYTVAINIGSTTTLKVAGFGPYWVPSAIDTALYTISAPPSTLHSNAVYDGNTSSPAITMTSTTSGNNLHIWVVTSTNVSVSSIADGGDTFGQEIAQFSPGPTNIFVTEWVAKNIGSGHTTATVTLSGSSFAQLFYVEDQSENTTTPLDQSANAGNSGGTGCAISTGPCTAGPVTTTSNDLCYGLFLDSQNTGWTASSPFAAVVSTGTTLNMLESYTQGSAGSISASAVPTSSPGTGWVSSIPCFKK